VDYIEANYEFLRNHRIVPRGEREFLVDHEVTPEELDVLHGIVGCDPVIAELAGRPPGGPPEVIRVGAEEFEKRYEELLNRYEPQYQQTLQRELRIEYAVEHSFNEPWRLQILYNHREAAWSKTISIGDEETAGVLVDQELPGRVYRALASVQICPLPIGNLGCDGSIYKLIVSMGFTKYSFEWWVDLPVALNPIASVVEELAAEFPRELLKSDLTALPYNMGRDSGE
jgi:hypothetical protein